MKVASLLLSLTIAVSAMGQAPVSLDSCRNMALANNKQLMMSRQQIQTAKYQKKEAFAAYLPALDFAGGYVYNQKNISIFGSDQMLPTQSFNLQTQKYEYNLVKNPATGEPVINPETGMPIPETIALIPKDAMEFDIHNVFFGALTLTQPIFMGGKIVALNKITKYAEELAQQMHSSEAENVIYAVDAAYWQVVSLKAKYKLAQSYVNLLDSLQRNVKLMVEQGVATKSDQLSVDVKVNSAKVDLTKVENGLVLSRMALAQVCGLPLDETFTLEDEDLDNLSGAAEAMQPYDIQQVYQRRHDLQALRLGIDIMGQKKKVAMSSMLPTIAAIGAYSFSNPNMYNGYQKKVAGGFSVGVTVTVPIWHWGGNYYKYKAAESEELAMKLKLQDAEELVSLQVKQAAYRADESLKTYEMTQSNLESANQNLRSATVAFREGVATTDNVMAAQTAWLKANSECIDAMIDVHLCDTYLSKVLGTMVE